MSCGAVASVAALGAQATDPVDWPNPNPNPTPNPNHNHNPNPNPTPNPTPIPTPTPNQATDLVDWLGGMQAVMLADPS